MYIEAGPGQGKVGKRGIKALKGSVNKRIILRGFLASVVVLVSRGGFGHVT
jgi:hypothetical protein